MLRYLLLLAPLLGVHAAVVNETYDPLQYVDQLIGSVNGGDVFVGASLPYGMAKAVADTDAGDNQGGFALDGDVTGFSSMHDSGTGGSPSLGNFQLFPYTSCPASQDDPNGCTFPKIARTIPYVNTSIVATPGYFSIQLESGITVDMTVAQHTSLFRFSFPDGDAATPLILMDLTDLSDSRQDNGTISVDDAGHMTGNGIFLPSFGSGQYTSYFCADFQGATVEDTGIFVGNRSSADVKNLTISRSINGYPLPGGAFVRFSDVAGPILARVGVSLISSDQACSNAASEIPDYDFNTTHQAAVTQWRTKLSPIKVSTGGGVNQSFLTNFYSGVYRTMLNPQNYTGENPLWSSSEPYWDSFYCIWDLFRSQMPFLTILDPVAVTEQIRSLIDTYRHLGWLPDCRMSLCKGFTQGGSNADNVITDAYLKGLSGGIDWDTAYAAVVNDAENEPYDWCCNGRGGLDSWKSVDYIPVQDFDYKGFGTQTRSISRTLEYSYNDFVISELGNGLGGHQSDVQKYLERSGNWQNLFKANQTSFNNGNDTGFEGFFQPKFFNGTWGFQDPLECSNIDTNPNSVCSLQNDAAETFESSIWEYSFFVPHDQASLIQLFGGPQAFVNRLNYLHDQQITYIGNEPAFLTVYQYHYAGRPALSAQRAHYYIPSYFDPSPGGLPGNDDSGTMGAFVAFSMGGLFPNPGQNVYLIIPPFFEAVSWTSPVTGRTASIRNINYDPTYQAIYIQSATLTINGTTTNYTKNWLDHSFFLQGGELTLTLGRNESTWGTRIEDLPPSVGEYTAGGNVTTKRSLDVEFEGRSWLGLPSRLQGN